MNERFFCFQIHVACSRSWMDLVCIGRSCWSFEGLLNAWDLGTKMVQALTGMVDCSRGTTKLENQWQLEPKGTEKGKSGVNAHASLFNRFLQTGGSSKITRTSGAYGGASTGSVSFAMVGNLSPNQCLFRCWQRLKTEFCFSPHRGILPHEPVLETGLFGPEFPPELAELAGIPVEILTERAAGSRVPVRIVSCFWFDSWSPSIVCPT